MKDVDTCESQFFMSAVHWKRHRNMTEVLGEQGDQCSGPSGHAKGRIQLIHIIDPNATQEKRPGLQLLHHATCHAMLCK